LRNLLTAVLILQSLQAAEASPGGQNINGLAVVIDGDTITIGQKKIRLYGIDAPEKDQICNGPKGPWSCGDVTFRRLKSLVQGNQVKCTRKGLDVYERLIAVCSVNELDVSETLVREGLAWAYLRYSSAYQIFEAEAKKLKKGVFSSPNVTPWDFRASRWSLSISSNNQQENQGCPIKGNVNKKGEKIYHLPWQNSYLKTKIDMTRGERWFCTEQEAENSGWRLAGMRKNKN
jgi:endonuclease YncB( thermonuclease family)